VLTLGDDAGDIERAEGTSCQTGRIAFGVALGRSS
jgi:hypothetical protein